MKTLFSKDFVIDDFEDLKLKAKNYVNECLSQQHKLAMSSIEEYQKFKPETVHLEDLDFYTRNSYDFKYMHSLNVSQNCIKLAKIEGNVSVQVMELIGILHDIAYFGCSYNKHGIVSAQYSEAFLHRESSLDSNDIRKIGKIISAHYPEDNNIKCFCWGNNLSLEEVLIVEADFLDKCSLKNGVRILLECGSKKCDFKDAVYCFEKKMVTRCRDMLNCSERDENCCCTDSFYKLLERQLKYNESLVLDLKKQTGME